MASNLIVDRSAWVIRFNGRELTLPYQEFLLLAFLAENPGKVFSRRELVKGALASKRKVNERGVDLYIARLRRRLGEDGERLLVTVRNVGYRLDMPREPSQTSSESAPLDPQS